MPPAWMPCVMPFTKELGVTALGARAAAVVPGAPDDGTLPGGGERPRAVPLSKSPGRLGPGPDVTAPKVTGMPA